MNARRASRNPRLYVCKRYNRIASVDDEFVAWHTGSSASVSEDMIWNVIHDRYNTAITRLFRMKMTTKITLDGWLVTVRREVNYRTYQSGPSDATTYLSQSDTCLNQKLPLIALCRCMMPKTFVWSVPRKLGFGVSSYGITWFNRRVCTVNFSF